MFRGCRDGLRLNSIAGEGLLGWVDPFRRPTLLSDMGRPES